MYKKIILASGPVIVQNNQVLLDKDYKDDYWKFCGGKVEENENLEETCRREVKEELNTDIKIKQEKPFIMHLRQEKENGVFDVILAHFLAEIDGEIKKGEDIKEYGWFDINKLPDDLAPNIIPVLKHFKFL